MCAEERVAQNVPLSGVFELVRSLASEEVHKLFCAEQSHIIPKPQMQEVDRMLNYSQYPSLEASKKVGYQFADYSLRLLSISDRDRVPSTTPALLSRPITDLSTLARASRSAEVAKTLRLVGHILLRR